MTTNIVEVDYASMDIERMSKLQARLLTVSRNTPSRKYTPVMLEVCKFAFEQRYSIGVVVRMAEECYFGKKESFSDEFLELKRRLETAI